LGSLLRLGNGLGTGGGLINAAGIPYILTGSKGTARELLRLPWLLRFAGLLVVLLADECIEFWRPLLPEEAPVDCWLLADCTLRLDELLPLRVCFITS
jgi:hypothetical protein